MDCKIFLCVPLYLKITLRPQRITPRPSAVNFFLKNILL
jgi:hypothetical protein